VGAAKRDLRRRILAAFAKRAIHAMRAQQDRVYVTFPADYDLDFYAHAAWQLRETCRQAIDRLGLDDLRDPLAELDEAFPRLREYRDAMTHALDDRIHGWSWFGDFVGVIHPGGAVEHVFGIQRGQHNLFERFYDQVIQVLDPEGDAKRRPTGGAL
jgi:hypothetical protein